MSPSPTMWMVFLCVWLHLGTSASGDRVKLVGIRPPRIFAEAKRPLEVSCSLNDMVDHNLTSADISFRWKHKRQKWPISPVYVQTPNTSTAVLLLRQVDRDHDRFLLSCYVGDNDDSIFVRVGFKPKPSVGLAVTADNWETMTINWTKERNPHFRTTTFAYWKMGRAEHFNRCLNQNHVSSNNSMEYYCWVSMRGMDLDRTTFFTIKVNSSNSLGSITTQDEIFYLHEINKPGKINTLRPAKVGTTWVLLEWSSPSHVSQNQGRTLVYNVTATCLQTKQVLQVRGTTALHLSLNVTGLMPGTSCELSIATQSPRATIWSHPYTFNITTKESVPLALPLTTRGAFDISSSGQEITLYWQPVPAHLRGGRIRRYSVIQRWKGEDGQPESAKYDFEATEKCQYQFINRYPDKESNLSVVASTSIGYNESILVRAPVIVMPKALIETQRPQNVTVLMTAHNVTEVHWGGRAEGEYTGYWCVSSDKTCESIISWTKHITSPWRIPQPPQVDHMRYRFGISLDLDAASSGISWSDCIFQKQAKSGPPTVEENVMTESSISLKLKQAARCSVDAGFIYAYQISYCPTDGSKCDVENVTVSREDKTTAVELVGLHENTEYRVSVYSVTVAGASPHPVTHLITTSKGVKSEIKSKLGIYVCVGIVVVVALVLSCVGIYCAFTKCGRECRKKARTLDILFKLPEENTDKGVNSKEMPIGYAVPYRNLKHGTSSPGERPQDMIGSYRNVERPPLPPRMESLSRGDNDSGISFTSEVSTRPPHAPSPVKQEQPPQFVSIHKGGSAEDILDQNKKNIMKDKDYDDDYNYAPTMSLDETVGGTSKCSSSSDSTASSGDESDQYKEAVILLKDVKPHPASNASQASGEEAPDLSGSSYGYKPVLLHDMGKSSTPLLSRSSPLPPQPPASSSQFGGPWAQVQPASNVIQDEPVSVLLDPTLILPMSDGDHIDCFSVEDNNLEDNDSDYGYAPNPGLVIGTPDNAWYPE